MVILLKCMDDVTVLNQCRWQTELISCYIITLAIQHYCAAIYQSVHVIVPTGDVLKQRNA